MAVQAPDPSFTADELLACGPPLEVNFTANSATAIHQWDFGDGNTGNSTHPLHIYQQFGSFDVKHVVVDSKGCRDTLVKQDYINIGVNTLGIQVRDSSVCIGDTLFFQSNTPANSSITWDFGNGDSSTNANPYYIYPQAGTYNVWADISDGSGCQVALQLSVTVHDKPLVEFTTADTTLGCEVPFQVDFINQTQGGLSYEWNFGDGSLPSYQTHPTHIYTKEDTFFVRLTATGPGGCRVHTIKYRYIKIHKYQTGFQADKLEGCAPLQVNFTDTTQSPFPINSWQWDFGNGMSSNQARPTSTYLNPGTYDVSLVVSNTRGCQDTTLMPAYIEVGLKPVVDFAIDTNVACAYGPIQFTNQSLGAQDFIWYFSDGDTAMSLNPTHGFGALGMMDVMLVGSDRGCRDTMVRADLVEVLAPLPIMGISDRRICETPQQVFFSDLSIGADRVSWALNNAFVTNQQSWTHTFTQDGVNAVSMTVENDSTGCIITAGNTVTVERVQADFVPDTNRSCVPFQVDFQDRSVNAVKWYWYFDNRADSSLVQNPSYTYRDAGSYEPTLVVQNSINCKDTFRYSSLQALDLKADFRITSDSAGCIPFDVSFEDLSSGTGSVALWEWDMGDSSSYQQPNPLHTFDSQRFYDISLKVTDGDGCVDSLTKRNQVYATQPIPDFVINPPVNCSDKNSVFVSLSSGAGLTYLWDLGDGTTSTLANVNHSYAQNGLYSVSLQVTDVNGCDSSVHRPDAVLISEIRADFTADSLFAPCPPLTVNFEADTAFPHADIRYVWDFGDGATSTSTHPSHIYTQPGTYSVSLILETPTGCSDTLFIQDMIEVKGPSATFDFDPKAACPGSPIDFQAQSAFSVDYEWIFGDGDIGTGQNSTHSYAQAGTYTPVLVVEDSAGCRVFHVADEDLTIYSPPLANFTTGDTLLCDSGVVTFTPLTQQSSPLSSFLWFTENGDSSSLTTPSFTFNQVGTRDIGLQIEDQNGCRDTLVKETLIEVVPSPKPGILLSDSSGCLSLEITASLASFSHPYALTQYQWEAPGHQGQGPGINLSFTDSGSYPISLIVWDENGCSGEAENSAEAFPLPEAAFVASDSFGCSPFALDFQDQSRGDLESWQWNFGDGQQSSQANPSHVYLEDGVYSVDLRVRNIFGCEDRTEKRNYIHLDHPEAEFSLDPGKICPGESVSFTNLSQSDTLLTSYLWDFGDSSRSRLLNPVHSFTEPGLYDVSLIVEDIFQCRDSFDLRPAVEVFEDVTPEPVDIRYVSVLNDNAVEILFDSFPNTRGDFASYQILRKKDDGSYESLDIIEDIGQTRYVDILPDERLLTQSQCYKVMVTNRCGSGHDLALSREHCTIELRAVGGIEAVELSWEAYQGWDRVRSYQLFRVNDYDPNDMVILGDFSANERSYTDLDMYCYDSYSYRLLARGPEPGLLSFSDTAFATPLHLQPDQQANILKVSVENNDHIQVEWEVPEVEDGMEVILERDKGSGFEEVWSQEYREPSLKYQDLKTEVQDQSYAYRIFVMDSCGDYTPEGWGGRSIHLRTSQEGSDVGLGWNPYEGWPSGVKAYRVELFDRDNNAFRVLARLGGDQTEFIHKNADRSQFENCYRVIAESEDNDEVISLSNEACQALDPVVFYPNAFSPNGDGVNDLFLLKGYFLDQFEMKIFDRWGKVVHQSTRVNQGWNGRNTAGKAMPEGVYVFQVSGIGQNGTAFERTGTLSLLR